MRDAEMLVWAGDFNYRIEVGYEAAMHHIRSNDLDYLLDRVKPLIFVPFHLRSLAIHVSACLSWQLVVDGFSCFICCTMLLNKSDHAYLSWSRHGR